MAALQAAFLNAGSGELFIHHALGHHPKYIKIFWNHQRRHSRLGYLSPALFAEKISRWQLAA